MDKKVVIITGASSGIGAAVARRLGREGMCLTLAARRTERLEVVAEEVRIAGGEALVLPVDVIRQEDIDTMLKTTLEHWGRVDVLFNNAGVNLDRRLVNIEPGKIHTEVLINLEAIIHCARVVLPIMLQQKSGHIINTASIAGLIALPGSSIYSATKFGMVGFSDALRRELLGTGVHVSTFCPGYTPSELTPDLKKHAEGRTDAPNFPGLMPVRYVADQVAWLLSHPRRWFVIPKRWGILIPLAFLFPGIADMIVPLFRVRRD